MTEGLDSPLAGPPVPDAQDTVKDFMDYTDVFPSDLMRSLTLIGKLDQIYLDTTDEIHKLTSTYGSLPELPPAGRPEAHTLRKQISAALDYALYCRESAFAEASRLLNVAERYDDRLGTIKRKLQALPEPPSRDPTPPPISPRRSRKQDPERGPRLTLHLDRARAAAGGADGLKHHGSRVTVPGDVLPLGTVGSPASSAESDWEDSTPASPVHGRRAHPRTHSFSHPEGRSGPGTSRKVGIVMKAPKAPRVRAPGVMGTNVHSAIAGISTSNALAKLTPPPGDAKPGSRHAPWHKLTEYEMAMLRKTMKKNAIWNPSDTMIRRELSKKNRGRENYERAKAIADASGEAFLDEDPLDPSKTVFAPGEVSFQPTGKDEQQLMNRGMKLNEAKKLKKETLAREQAVRDAMEIEEASRAITNAGNLVKNAFSKLVNVPEDTSPASHTDLDPSKSSKKRKRQTSPESGRQGSRELAETPVRTGPKRLKIAPPAPPSNYQTSDTTLSPARGTSTASPIGTISQTTTTHIPLAPAGPTSTVPVPAPPNPSSARDVPSPTAASPTETKRAPFVPTATAATSRSRRTSVAVKAGSPPSPAVRSDAGPVGFGTSRPRSRAGAAAAAAAVANTSTKAASAEPPAMRESRELRELRRMSNVSLPSPSDSKGTPARHGPAPGIRSSGRLGRRPAPGLVTADEDGRKVSVGKRKAAPRKKTAAGTGRWASKGRSEAEGRDGDAAQSASAEAWDDADPVDPDEPRYCVCGDVSYGTMIACENDDCEKEWFHLACVGMTEIPPRRTKWYCEDCRAALGIDEKGHITEQNGPSSGRRLRG